MYGFYLALQITSYVFAIIANVTHLPTNLRTCEVPKILWDRSLGYSGAVRIDSKNYFGQMWLQTMSGLHINRNCMLVDLSEIESVIDILADRFLFVVTYIAWFGKTI